MNRLTLTRALPVIFIATLVLAAACEKKKTPAQEQPAAAALPPDRVPPKPVATSQTILEKTFTLKTSATFPFEGPAHSVRPHLHGIFESFVRELHGASDNTANVDFLIVNADQYADLTSNRPSEALFTVDASHNQSVNLDLPPALDQPANYYLIFRNPAKALPKVVEANFHVDF